MDKREAFMKAKQAMTEGELDEAVAGYRSILADSPDDAPVVEGLVEALLSKGEVRDALKELFQAAHRAIWRKCYLDATKLLNRMIEVDPERRFLVTRGVQGCLDEIRRAESDSGMDFDRTSEMLEALVVDETTEGFAVPEEILRAIDREPVKEHPSLALSLDLGDSIIVPVTAREFHIGSDESCDLVLPEEAIADFHARLIEMDGQFLLSRAGGSVQLNGEEIDIAPVGDGDRIRLPPDIEMTVRLGSDVSPQDT